MRKAHPKKFFSEEEKLRLSEAIEAAEKKTSGEIRVHLQLQSKEDPMKEAREVFEKLGMIRTGERNGILLFLSLIDHQFVILGDKGIHEKVHDEFWHKIRDEVIRHFKEKKFVEGLVAAIHKCGVELGRYFPRRAHDRDELSNDVTTS